MSAMRGRWKPWFARMALLAAVSACALAACTVTGVGVGYDGGDDYVGGFYEPYGYDYGGWGGGYGVGPRWGYRGRDGHGGDGRGGEHGPGPSHGQGAGGGRPYHAAPPARGMPSIPHGPRGH